MQSVAEKNGIAINYTMIQETSVLEVDLLRRLRQNDEEALAGLMKLYYNDLYSYASRFCSNAQTVKDCIQEVFINLWERRETAEITSPRYYLLKAVKNKVLKATHKDAFLNGMVGLENAIGTSDDFTIEKDLIEKELSREKADQLRCVFTMLTERQKEVIYLKYYQHLDNVQISELMNISRQSVYNLLHETIQKLRGIISEQYVLK